MSTPLPFPSAMPMSFLDAEKEQIMKAELTFIAENLNDREAMERLKLYLECQKLVYELNALRPRRSPRSAV